MTDPGSLSRRYALLIGGTVVAVLLVTGLVEGWAAWRDSRLQIANLARLQATAASERIERYAQDIARQMVWVTLPIPELEDAALARRRYEYRQLLRMVPAISQARHLDVSGREVVRVSRFEPDAVGSGIDASREPAFIAAGSAGSWFGPVRFEQESEPHLTIAVASPQPFGGVAVAEVNLGFTRDLIATLHSAGGGYAYAVDARGLVVAHPDQSLVFRHTDFSSLSQVRSVLAPPSATATSTAEPMIAADPDGRPVFVAHAPIRSLGWTLFVEEPLAEALAPLYQVEGRIAALLLLGLALAAATGALLARRVSAPILELEKANHAKTHFLAAASHDLRQPMHALGLFAAQLASKNLPAEAKRIADQIDASARALSELLDALLDISQLDAGGVIASKTDFALHDLLQSIGLASASAAQEKGLRLRVMPTRLAVHSDPVLLQRIVMNLVANAIRYTDSGGLVVGCRRNGDFVRIVVCDTGRGIAPENREEIFREFHRLPVQGGEVQRGLGLGLTIVERLARVLGHAVRVDSSVGRGSTFGVEVPRTRLPAITTASRQESRIAPSALGALVALVEDDPGTLEGMRGLLESWGCEVLAAPTAATARDRIAAHDCPPDLAISDYRLGGGSDGIAAIAGIREACGRPSLPAILVSADTSADTSEAAHAAGLTMLAKPVAPMRLRALVSHLLQGQS